ncbi:MAG: type II toxin-antitoxin system RelE/ParE family toxin [Methanobacteriota archaeon]|nr:MAG: type II toxin-antitoxin system RelE/ParE family toxin [Euryarchaeota archaeon]
MTFEIIWSDSAVRQLKKLERAIAKRIFDAVTKLEKDPTRWVSRIVNSPYFRLRVGDFRVIIDIQKRELRVLVLKVGHRRSVYSQT